MKKIFRFSSIFLSLVICLCLLFSSYTCLNVRAVNSDRIVSKRTGQWGTFAFEVKTDNYYIINDPTGLTTSTYVNPFYYYTNDNEFFYSIESKPVFVNILNNITGIILDPSNVNTFFNIFCTLTGLLDSQYNLYAKNGLYDSEGNFYGYCINDIGGCSYGLNPVETVTIGKDFSDNVYNYYNYYDSSESLYPDFITFYPPSVNTIASNNTQNLNSDMVSNLNSIYSTVVGNGLTYSTTTSKYQIFTGTSFYYAPGLSYLVPVDNQSYDRWNKFCGFYALSSGNNSLSYNDLISNRPTTSSDYRIFYNGLNPYDSSNNIISESVNYNLSNGSTTTYNTAQSYNLGFSDSSSCSMPFCESVTIFKSTQIKSNLDNHLYQPSSYVTDSYKDYSNNIENSFNTTRYAVDNSVTYNESIYNDSNDSFYEYYDNGYYDSSSSTTNITNITNNYYGQASPDNPDDPDDPDNPSGTLDAILQAILRFFNAIGDIIGTLLASIINLIDSVLEALAGVMENLTGMSDFFAALFGWIPEPVPEILGAGFGICLVCGIIKFIRG